MGRLVKTEEIAETVYAIDIAGGYRLRSLPALASRFTTKKGEFKTVIFIDVFKNSNIAGRISLNARESIRKIRETCSENAQDAIFNLFDTSGTAEFSTVKQLNRILLRIAEIIKNE